MTKPHIYVLYKCVYRYKAYIHIYILSVFPSMHIHHICICLYKVVNINLMYWEWVKDAKWKRIGEREQEPDWQLQEGQWSNVCIYLHIELIYGLYIYMWLIIYI